MLSRQPSCASRRQLPEWVGGSVVDEGARPRLDGGREEAERWLCGYGGWWGDRWIRADGVGAESDRGWHDHHTRFCRVDWFRNEVPRRLGPDEGLERRQ